MLGEKQRENEILRDQNRNMPNVSPNKSRPDLEVK